MARRSTVVLKKWQRREQKRKGQRKAQLDIRVLVVDDDPEIRDILRERLFIEGFQVVTAASGEEGLAKFLVHQGTPNGFDIVTLDIRMRDLSGRQVLSLLRKIDQRVCILMISGLDDLSQAVQSLSQGADDYLSKPIKIWAIRDRLVTALGRRASLVQREARKRGAALATGGHGSAIPAAPGRLPDDPDEPSGLEWGTAISPSPNYEDEDSPGDSESFSEPASSLQGLAGPGKPASVGSELSPPDMEMGRESGPGDRTVGRGTGENHAHDPRRGDRGGNSIEDPPAGNRASAQELEPSEGGRRGSLPQITHPSSPLETALELARRVENSWEGYEGHGEQVSRLVEKIGASLATSLGLSAASLDGLCLAARLHSLGLHERQDEDSREWYLESQQAADLLNRLPGREREDLRLVARILHVVLEEEEDHAASRAGSSSRLLGQKPALRIVEALLTRIGGHHAGNQDLDPALRQLLDEHLEEVEPENTGEGGEFRPTSKSAGLPEGELEMLMALYEVADGWIHLTHEGLGNMSPDHAFSELCGALTSRLPAHPTSMALNYLRTRI